MWVSTRQGAWRIEVAELEAIVAADDYVMLHAAAQSHLHRSRLLEVEASLPADDWVRVHRSALVRLLAIVSLHGSARRARVTLRSGRVVAVSRSHLPVLRARLGLDRPRQGGGG